MTHWEERYVLYAYAHGTMMVYADELDNPDPKTWIPLYAKQRVLVDKPEKPVLETWLDSIAG